MQIRAIIENTHLISVKKGNNRDSGTGFQFIKNGVIYMITAAHVIESSMKHGKKSEFFIRHHDLWDPIEGIPFFKGIPNEKGEYEIDIAVIKTSLTPEPTDINRSIELKPGYDLGQTIYFSGFPFPDVLPHQCHHIINEKPIAFLKHGIIAACHGYPYIYIDAHNNPGFSGGPIFYWDSQEKQHKVIGIMSSYQKHNNEDEKIHYENSGIAIGIEIKYAIELVEEAEKTGI